ncbi:MAG TPA: hypothetical protein VN922_02475 [Bacteroidia bacterium]|nr:hypothetical protein [Bacteroidia bacterium]
MILTVEEFCRFNLVSRVAILNNEGLFLIKKKVDEVLEARLFLLHDFYVEIYYDRKNKEIVKADPVRNNKWLKSFYMGIVNRFNFC